MRRPARARTVASLGLRGLARGVWWLVVLLVLLPLLYLVVRGGAMGDAVPGILADPATKRGILVSLALSAAVGVAALVIALPLAWLTHATDLPGRRFFRVVTNLPLAVPSYVSGFVVVAGLGPSGWVGMQLERLGIPWELDLYRVAGGGLGAGLALLFCYPLALLTLQAALRRIEPAQWDAARSLGASPARAFARVILPRLWAPMVTGFLLVALYVLGDFGAVSLLRVESLSYLIYLRYKSLIGREEAVILALLLAVIALLLVVTLRFATRSRGGTELGARPWRPVALGRWRWPAFGFCALIATLGVAAPLFVLVAWLLRGIRLGHELAIPWRETWNALWLGAVGGALVVGLALLPKLRNISASRRRGGAETWVGYLGYVLPGIVVALALVSYSVRHARPMYQTIYLLLGAYVIRFLPLATGSVDDAISRHSPRLVEAARSLGAGPVRAWSRVVVPVARGALFAGFLSAFIAIVKELPATLLASPIEFRTLATSIWAHTEEAYYSAAAPASLLLVLLAAAALIVAGRLDGSRGDDR